MLEGKTALISGGGTGIGRATGLRLAAEGANIVVNYSRSVNDAIQTQRDIEALGRGCMIYQADVSVDDQVREMADAAIKEFKRLDILVNSAGITHFIPQPNLDDLKDEHWDSIMGVNVKGVFNCCRAVASELKKQKGSIVNITSIGGITGQGSSIAYAASKAAAISVTKSLARVMAPEVRVNGIAPGVVKTRWVDGHEDFVERLAGETPLGRVATAEDVAEVAYSLIANAGFVTGQNIIVDGGTVIG